MTRPKFIKDIAMRFSPQEIDAAIKLHHLALPWEPRPGHYVWDQTGLMERDSPFQNGVYIILDLKPFVRRAGTLHVLKRSMVWLPTWREAREALESLGVDNAEIMQALQTQQALRYRHELLTLYGLIASHLEASGARSGVATGQTRAPLPSR
jgi:hypothetical protein